MSSEYINQLKIGTTFPSSSSSTLCGIKVKQISKSELLYVKKKILDYMKTHEGAYITDLVNALRVEPRKIVIAINELKDEGLLI